MFSTARSLMALVLVVSMLAPLLAMSVPVSAEPEVMDLVIGGSGSEPWAISNIAPGDNGTEVLELRNAGSIDGYVTIWFSDIVGTDGGTDGANLSDHFLLTPLSEGLHSDLGFPATFDSLPRSVLDRAIVIGPLAAGTSVDLTWAWEFFDNGVQQNDAQGDGLSFTINYLMTATGPGDHASWLAIDVLGEVTMVAINSTGHVQAPCQAAGPNRTVVLDIPAGTQIVAEDGGPLLRLVLSEADIENALQGTNATALSETFVLEGFGENGAAKGVVFSPCVRISIAFDPALLPEGNAPGVYQQLDGEWGRLNDGGPYYEWFAQACIGGTGVYIAGACDDHEGMALLRSSVLVFEGSERVFWLEVLPLFIEHNFKVSVSVDVVNVGNAPGNFTLELVLDGEVANTAELYLAPGQSDRVTFHLDNIPQGDHQVSIGDADGRFRTYTWTNWPMIWAVAAVCVLAALVAYGLKRGRGSG